MVCALLRVTQKFSYGSHNLQATRSINETLQDHGPLDEVSFSRYFSMHSQLQHEMMTCGIRNQSVEQPCHKYHVSLGDSSSHNLLSIDTRRRVSSRLIPGCKTILATYRRWHHTYRPFIFHIINSSRLAI